MRVRILSGDPRARAWAGSTERRIWELKPVTFSVISRLKPETTAIAASITATDRAMAAVATRTAGVDERRSRPKER